MPNDKLAAEILGKDDCPRKAVQVPEWGLTLWIRTLGSDERDAFEVSKLRKDKDGEVNLDNFRACLVALCAVDEQGQQIFQEDQAAALGKKSPVALDRLFQVAKKLNRVFLSPAETEELEKNSAATAGVSSPTASPSPSGAPTSTASSAS